MKLRLRGISSAWGDSATTVAGRKIAIEGYPDREDAQDPR